VRWIFYEDYAREKIHEDCARENRGSIFHPRPVSEADPIVRFAYELLSFGKHPKIDARHALSIVAYANIGGAVITGFQGDYFTSTEHVYRADWNIYFDAKDHINGNRRIVTDEADWARLVALQPIF
jgi:hypothetical protein